MAIVRDRKFLDSDGTVSSKLLFSCINEHRLEVEARLNKLNDYYEGAHKILDRTFKNKNIPNNKIVCNHAEYITDLAIGYVFGVPISYSGDGADALNINFTEIDEDSHNNELALDLSIFGRTYELIYMNTDEKPKIELASLSPLNTFLVVDTSVKEKPMFAVHYYPNITLENTIKNYTVEIYTESEKLVYEIPTLDGECSIEKEVDIDEHYFNGIPIIEYTNNKKARGDFEGVIALIDAYNKLQSDRVNDKEQLVDAFLVLIGQNLGDSKEEVSETVQYLLEQKILELDDGGDAKWLIKSLSEDQVEVLKKSLKDDIHEFSKVPCLTDENFVGNASGVAMKYKLLGLEQLGKTKERYFKKGLRKRLKLIENLEGIRANNIKSSDIDISMKRSLPVDDELLARIAQETEGFISWETRIKNYDPEIDINEERKRLEEEKKRNIEEQQKAFGFPYDKSDNPNNEDENTDKEDDVVNEE